MAATMSRRGGYEQHADVVGAMNVLARGHRVAACGEEGAGSGRRTRTKAASASGRGLGAGVAGESQWNILRILISN
jgi:hypothetical protein